MASKETEKDALKAELDEVYVLFSDADTDAKKYKARLQEKGETITDDEETDGDGDEEGEEEEEEQGEEGKKAGGDSEVD